MLRRILIILICILLLPQAAYSYSIWEIKPENIALSKNTAIIDFHLYKDGKRVYWTRTSYYNRIKFSRLFNASKIDSISYSTVDSKTECLEKRLIHYSKKPCGHYTLRIKISNNSTSDFKKIIRFWIPKKSAYAFDLDKRNPIEVYVSLIIPRTVETYNTTSLKETKNDNSSQNLKSSINGVIATHAEPISEIIEEENSTQYNSETIEIKDIPTTPGHQKPQKQSNNKDSTSVLDPPPSNDNSETDILSKLTPALILPILAFMVRPVRVYFITILEYFFTYISFFLWNIHSVYKSQRNDTSISKIKSKWIGNENGKKIIDIFKDPNLRFTARNDSSKNSLKSKELIRKISNSIDSNFLISGHPGGGKSTLLRWVMLSSELRIKGFIFLYCDAKDLVLSFSKEENTAENFIYSLSKSLSLRNCIFHETTLKILNHHSRLVVLIDGLDELTNEKWVSFRESFKRFTQYYPNITFVFSARESFIDLQEMQINNMLNVSEENHYEISSYDYADLLEIINNWGDGKIYNAHKLLYHISTHSKIMYWFDRSPLLVNMLCYVYDKKDNYDYISKTLPDFYSEVINALTYDWDTIKGFETEYIKKLNSNSRDANKPYESFNNDEEALTYIKNFFANYANYSISLKNKSLTLNNKDSNSPIASDLDITKVANESGVYLSSIHDLIVSSGMIKKDNNLEFSHQTFLEYFLAFYHIKNQTPPKVLMSTIQSNHELFGDWTLVFLLCLNEKSRGLREGYKYKDILVKLLIESGSNDLLLKIISYGDYFSSELIEYSKGIDELDDIVEIVTKCSQIEIYKDSFSKLEHLIQNRSFDDELIEKSLKTYNSEIITGLFIRSITEEKTNDVIRIIKAQDGNIIHPLIKGLFKHPFYIKNTNRPQLYIAESLANIIKFENRSTRTYFQSCVDAAASMFNNKTQSNTYAFENLAHRILLLLSFPQINKIIQDIDFSSFKEKEVHVDYSKIWPSSSLYFNNFYSELISKIVKNCTTKTHSMIPLDTKNLDQFSGYNYRVFLSIVFILNDKDAINILRRTFSNEPLLTILNKSKTIGPVLNKETPTGVSKKFVDFFGEDHSSMKKNELSMFLSDLDRLYSSHKINSI